MLSEGVELFSKRDLKELELRLGYKIDKLEQSLILKLGGILGPVDLSFIQLILATINIIFVIL